MMRKFFSVLVGLTLPAWVFALGLGNLELNSGLNQPFDAKSNYYLQALMS